MPGDPARLLLGPAATGEMVQTYRQRYGLNEPLPIQFIIYLQQLARGDLGYSFQSRRAVVEDIRAFFPATFELTTSGLVLAVVIGLPLGVMSARHRNRWPDSVARLFSIFGVSSPEFVSAIIAQLVLGFALGLFPTTGRFPSYPPPNPPHQITGLLILDSILTLDAPALLTSIHYLILPAFVLSLPQIAQICRFVRSRMIEESVKDYVLTAKANGFPSNLIVYKYMLKNAFSSTLTLIGLLYGFLLGGDVLVEWVFAWPGIGSYMVRSILMLDYAPVVGVVMIIGLSFVIVNLIVDMLYGYLDPRVTYT